MATPQGTCHRVGCLVESENRRLDGSSAVHLAGLRKGGHAMHNRLVVSAFMAAVTTLAFALGTQATHPGVKVRLVWTHDWVSPEKERKAAESLVAAGVDVLGQNVDTPTAGQFAESKNIPWVGYDSDAQKFAPKSWLTAAVYDWGVYYLPRVKAAMNGTWKTGFYYGNIKDGFTDVAPFGPKVSSKTKAQIGAKRKAIVDGTFSL